MIFAKIAKFSELNENILTKFFNDIFKDQSLRRQLVLLLCSIHNFRFFFLLFPLETVNIEKPVLGVYIYLHLSVKYEK